MREKDFDNVNMYLIYDHDSGIVIGDEPFVAKSFAELQEHLDNEINYYYDDGSGERDIEVMVLKPVYKVESVVARINKIKEIKS